MTNPWKSKSKINPQAEDGHRRIANSVFKALMGARLTGAEYAVALCVIDRTWGYQGETAEMAFSEIGGATGLHRDSVRKAIKSLYAKRIVFFAPLGQEMRGGRLNVMGFNKCWDTWKTDGGPAVTRCPPSPGADRPPVKKPEPERVKLRKCPPGEIHALFVQAFNRHPNGFENHRLAQMQESTPQAELRRVFREAGENGAKSLKYVEAILAGKPKTQKGDALDELWEEAHGSEGVDAAGGNGGLQDPETSEAWQRARVVGEGSAQ